MVELNKPGFVTLAGAGPGDAELITLKLQKRLTEADVIITDRLVNPDIISVHSRKDALILFAGKQGYNDNSYSQEEVTALVIEDRKSTRLNSSHSQISYAVFCLKKKKKL